MILIRIGRLSWTVLVSGFELMQEYVDSALLVVLFIPHLIVLKFAKYSLLEVLFLCHCCFNLGFAL
jgi:hypothetical protein